MTPFKDPGTVKIRENKLVTWIYEENPKKANVSTQLDRASVCLCRMRDCQATHSLPPTIAVSMGRQCLPIEKVRI